MTYNYSKKIFKIFPFTIALYTYVVIIDVVTYYMPRCSLKTRQGKSQLDTKAKQGAASKVRLNTDTENTKATSHQLESIANR